MSEIKISLTGRLKDSKKWHIDEEITHGNYHLQVSRNNESLKLTFEHFMEQTRYYDGVQLCRTKYTNSHGQLRFAYVTSMARK